MNGRYVDENNVFARSIGRELKFCPMAGCLVKKSEDEVKECENMTEDDHLFANKLGKILHRRLAKHIHSKISDTLKHIYPALFFAKANLNIYAAVLCFHG